MYKLPKESRRWVGSAVGMLFVFALGMVFPAAFPMLKMPRRWRIQPALFEQTVNPGDQFSTSVSVSNPGTGSRQFTVGVEDISGMSQGGEPVFSTSSVPEYGLSSWVELGKTVITVPAGAALRCRSPLRFRRTRVLAGITERFLFRPAQVGRHRMVLGLGYEVGALLEFRITGDAAEQAEIKEFSTDAGLYQSPKVTFNTTIANEGNILLQPRGPVDVTNMFGQKVGTIVMNDLGASIFPGTNRSFAATWTGSGFAFGQFTAVMTLNYGDVGNKTITASTAFWVVPVIPIVVVLGSIIFFILIFVWSVKMYVRRRVNAMVGNASREERPSKSEEERLLSGSELPLSRLVFIVIATAIFALIFLLVLFFFFG